MKEAQISMSEARQHLSRLVNRVAYGGERIILEAHGEAKAALVHIDDLRRLEQLEAVASERQKQFEHALDAADQVRERIKQWQEAHGIASMTDSAETLRQLREERDDELLGLR